MISCGFNVSGVWYGDSVEENSRIFSLVRMRWLPSARACGQRNFALTKSSSVLNWRCWLTQVDLYNGCKTVVVVVLPVYIIYRKVGLLAQLLHMVQCGRLSRFMSALIVRDKGGNVTSAGWQVTLCDPMWYLVSYRSNIMKYLANKCVGPLKR